MWGRRAGPIAIPDLLEAGQQSDRFIHWPLCEVLLSARRSWAPTTTRPSLLKTVNTRWEKAGGPIEGCGGRRGSDWLEKAGGEALLEGC